MGILEKCSTSRLSLVSPRNTFDPAVFFVDVSWEFCPFLASSTSIDGCFLLSTFPQEGMDA